MSKAVNESSPSIFFFFLLNHLLALAHWHTGNLSVVACCALTRNWIKTFVPSAQATQASASRHKVAAEDLCLLCTTTSKNQGNVAG